MEENVVLPSPMKNIMRSGLYPTKLEDSITRTRFSLYEHQFYSLMVFTIFDGQLAFFWRSFNLSFYDFPYVFFVMSEQEGGFPTFPPMKTSRKELVCRGNEPPPLGPIFHWLP